MLTFLSAAPGHPDIQVSVLTMFGRSATPLVESLFSLRSQYITVLFSLQEIKVKKSIFYRKTFRQNWNNYVIIVSSFQYSQDVRTLYQILLNADDFGRHSLINQAVETGVTKGILRSATLMPGGDAFEEAVEIAKKQKELGVGIHFTLVNGHPILPPSEIPSLVASDGNFHDNHGIFVKRFLRGKIRLNEVRSELAAQLNKMNRAGLSLSHADSHQHMHTLPGILSIVLELSAAAGIHAIRAPKTSVFYRGSKLPDPGQFIGRLGLGSLAFHTMRKARRKGFSVPDHFAGIVAGEAFDQSHLKDLLQHISPGTTEVMLHPGVDNQILQQDCEWDHDFESELKAVTSPEIIDFIQKNNIIPCNFNNFKNN